ncbi:MAG: class I SAM-dependent methyltransferase [Sulfurimonas sp.]|nr:class I SAM-dependent methyltransferase [Sulfurimonas sp.]
MNNCVVCNGNTKNIEFKISKSVSSDNRVINTPLSHSYCVDCGYIFIDIDKRVDYEKFYNEDYVFLLDGDVEPTLNDEKYSGQLANFYSEVIDNSKLNTFFDIGGGKGNFVQTIHNKFNNLDIYALEPSQSFEKLKEKEFLINSYNEFFVSSNFSKSFNYLSLIGVLEHVPNPKEFLLDIKNIMTKESFLLIEVPNFKNNKSDLLTIDHLSKFTEESLSNLFNICGFKIIKKQVLNSVPMQFIVQCSNSIENYSKINSGKTIESAVEYLENAIGGASSIKNDKISIYGQGLILDYLIGMKILKVDNICCIVDDNPLYQGKKYKNIINIVNFIDFKSDYTEINDIFLAMNDCYHNKVKDKLDNLNIYGIVK